PMSKQSRHSDRTFRRIVRRCHSPVAPESASERPECRARGTHWLVGTGLGAVTFADPHRSCPLSRQWLTEPYGSLYSSPRPEPGVQISRTGLPRSHFAASVRQPGDRSSRTAARTRCGSEGSTSTADGADCVGAPLESTAAAPRAERRRVSAGSDVI